MKDYEAKFWLPFKGVTKPVYAIPGNHDWYDALEGFVATFLQPDAARAAMRARIAEDGGLSSTTDARIEEYIDRAGFLRQQYGVPTGRQQAPFFQVQTPQFALLAVDTGVLRGVDADEMTWLKAALERSRGKLVMAVLGHPFLAGGHDLARDDVEFTALRDLLRAHDVRVVMAGDTHDLEYYAEPAGRAGGATDPPLGEWRRRRLSELRHLAGLAAVGRHRRLGVLSRPQRRGREDHQVHAVVEMAGLGVDAPVRSLAVVGRMAVGDVRLQRRPVLPELRRRHGRSGGAPADHPAVGRAWPADLERLRTLGPGHAARRHTG